MGIQTQQKIGRLESDYALPVADLFAGKEQQRHTAENVDATRKQTPRCQSGGEQHESPQQKRDKGEVLYLAAFIY